MSANIENKVVVITGASSGIGETTARHLAAEGARLVLGARRLDRLQALVAEIEVAGGEAIALQTDVTNKAQVEALVAAGVETYGRVDVVLNNAGLMVIAPMATASTDDWDRMIDINIKGLLYGVAAALPVFARQRSGHFINIASIAGHKVFAPGGTVYSATKFAVRALSEGLRQEVGGDIRTTVISPGAVDSELKLASSDAGARENLDAFYQLAIPSDAIAKAVAFAIAQPAEVDISEIMVRPTAQEF
jgi:NADP-dependent 3-hydroxy acid dehydrogenase YdfG